MAQPSSNDEVKTLSELYDFLLHYNGAAVSEEAYTRTRDCILANRPYKFPFRIWSSADLPECMFTSSGFGVIRRDASTRILDVSASVAEGRLVVDTIMISQNNNPVFNDTTQNHLYLRSKHAEHLTNSIIEQLPTNSQHRLFQRFPDIATLEHKELSSRADEDFTKFNGRFLDDEGRLNTVNLYQHSLVRSKFENRDQETHFVEADAKLPFIAWNVKDGIRMDGSFNHPDGARQLFGKLTRFGIDWFSFAVGVTQPITVYSWFSDSCSIDGEYRVVRFKERGDNDEYLCSIQSGVVWHLLNGHDRVALGKIVRTEGTLEVMFKEEDTQRVWAGRVSVQSGFMPLRSKGHDGLWEFYRS